MNGQRGGATRRAAGIVAGVALSALISACGQFQVNLPDPSKLVGSETDYASYARFQRHADAYWELRHKQPENGDLIRKAILNWEKVWAINPYDRVALTQLALAHYTLGNYFYEPGEAQLEIFGKGWEYGKKAVLLNPEIKAAYTGDAATFHKAIAPNLKAGDVPSVYWMTVNWAKVMENASLPKKAVSAPKMKTIMEAIYGVGPTYSYGAVHRFFGAYFCKAPGQSNPAENAKASFERAVAAFPEQLESKYMMARYYGVLIADEEFGERVIQEILDTPEEDSPPQLRFDNYHAKKRAQHLLDNLYEYY
jgi:hypothetical protein